MKFYRTLYPYRLIASVLIALCTAGQGLKPVRSQSTVDNPDYTAGCNATTKIALLVDASSSISGTGGTNVEEDVRQGLTALFQSLEQASPGSLQVGVLDFGTGAELRVDYTDISEYQNPTNSFDSYIQSYPNRNGDIIDESFTGNGGTFAYTNWEEAFRRSSSSLADADIVMIITDGNPTASLRDPGNTVRVINSPGGTNTTEIARALAQAVPASDILQNAGSKIYAVGLGTNVTEANLQAISGEDRFNIATGNTSEADYLLSSDIDNFVRQLSGLVQGVCPLPLSGTVFEDINYGGGNGRNFTTAETSATSSGFAVSGNNATGVNGARVELYSYDGSDTSTSQFIEATTTDADGNYNFDVSDGDYLVRVVNDTVTSNRPGATNTSIPVQTFRNDSDETTSEIVDEVGGANPAVVDASEVTTVGASLPGDAQSVTAITVNKNATENVDFGFNFDTIVNTNDSGQGSLRQFVLNSNELANTNLAQDLPAAITAPSNKDGNSVTLRSYETSIFMIPDPNNDNRVTAGTGTGQINLSNAPIDGGTGSAFTISTGTGALIVSDEFTSIDGRTQSVNVSSVDNPPNLTIGSNETTGAEVIITSTNNNNIIQGRSNNTIFHSLGIISQNDANAIGFLISNSGATGTQSTATSNIIIDSLTVAIENNCGIEGVRMVDSVIRNSVLRDSGENNSCDNIQLRHNSDRNIIDNNLILRAFHYGIDIVLTGNRDNIISNNQIVGNGRGSGTSGQDAGIGIRSGTNITIENNIIRDNVGDGITVTNVDIDSTANKITENSIYNNGDLGIDLGAGASGNGVTNNDNGDGDGGINQLQNFPVIDRVFVDGTNYTIQGTLNSTANSDFDIEIFSNNVCNPDRDGNAQAVEYGEGEKYHSTTTVTTDGTGVASFSTTVAINDAANNIFTATATDTSNNTSEFSQCETVSIPPIYDYGDAPDELPHDPNNPRRDYQTTADDNGAAQVVINDPTSGKVLSLGSNVDADSGELEDENALADDEDGTPDDEDGVANFPTLTTADQTYTVSVTAKNNITEEVVGAGTDVGVPAYLVGFIDFNKDGDFIDSNTGLPDPGERSETVTIGSGNSDLRTFNVSFNNVPSGMTPGDTYARFRLGQVEATAQQATGASAGTDNGEVEDYQIAISSPTISNLPPFICDSTLYIVYGQGGTNQRTARSQLSRINRSVEPFTFEPIGSQVNNYSYNALAYNPVDNYIYAIVESVNSGSPFQAGEILRIGSNGVPESLGIPGGDEIPYNPNAGTFLTDGTYVVGRQENPIYTIDLSTTPPTATDRGVVNSARFEDFAVNPYDTTSNRVYGIDDFSDKLVYFDLDNTSAGVTEAIPGSDTTINHNHGSQFYDLAGNLIYRSATNDKLYEINPSGEIRELADAPSGGSHDGASCFSVGLEKEVDATDPVPAGENVTYTYRIANSSAIPMTVTLTDDLRSVADYSGSSDNENSTPVNGTYTGTINTPSGTVELSNSDQTLNISDISLAPQSFTEITAEVTVPRTATPDTYYNQATIVDLPPGFVDQVNSDYPPSATYQDPTPLSVTESLVPNLLLVKRITAINPGQSDEVQFNSFVNDDSDNNGNFDDDPDNDPNWPDVDDTYLRGAINVADIQPGDEVEYTIYFLSNGEEDATNIKICDVVPDNMTFVTNSYGSEAGMGLALDETNLPTEPNRNLSNAADTDEGTFYAPGTAPPTVTFGDPPTERNLCSKVTTENTTVEVNATNNNNGAIVVEIDSLPEATDPGTPANSYGFVRFRAEIQ